MIKEKTNTEVLKEIQLTVDEINARKQEVETLLQVIDGLELKYKELVDTIKKKGK